MNNEIEKKNTLDERARELQERYGSLDSELPFIQPLRIAQKTSQVAENDICAVGDFYFGQDIALGSNVLGVVYDHKWHALKLVNKQVELESFDVVYGEPDEHGFRPIIGDDAFLTIMRGKDDIKNGITYCWGPELLVFLPEVGDFAVLFLHKKTSRKHWKEFLNPAYYNIERPLPCIFYTQKVAPPKLAYSWIEPHCRRATEDEEVEFAYPHPARIIAAKEKFMARKISEDGSPPPER